MKRGARLIECRERACCLWSESPLTCPDSVPLECHALVQCLLKVMLLSFSGAAVRRSGAHSRTPT